MQELRVNGKRLWESIMETAKFGATSRSGVSRLSLSDEDRRVRDWFAEACRGARCEVTVDDMGNMFARRSGRHDAAVPIAIGSHLDTQPAGGKFDGIAGVLSGLEVIRTLNDVGYCTEAPLEVINWTNEEGSRFAPPMLGSGVFAGVISRGFAYSREDRQGKKFGEELERIGYRGSARCGEHRLGTYFELHIEQGPMLEMEGKTIGVVTEAQGQRWYEVTLTGQAGHAGSTPMHLRKDALLGCARIVEGVNRIGLDHAPLAVSTVGLVEVRPNSPNVIPGSVFFTVDLRHPEDDMMAKMDAEFREMVSRVAGESGLGVELSETYVRPSTEFDRACVAQVREAAARLNYKYREMVSGPGHDALYVARVVPAALVFIPCEGGISHDEAENARPEDVEAGANVLLHVVLARDATTFEGKHV